MSEVPEWIYQLYCPSCKRVGKDEGNKGVIENNSGFRLFDLNFPSMGISAGILILVGFAIFLGYCCWKRCCKCGSQNSSNHNNANVGYDNRTQAVLMPMPMPQIDYSPAPRLCYVPPAQARVPMITEQSPNDEPFVHHGSVRVSEPVEDDNKSANIP